MIAETVYSVSGTQYKYEVYKPSTGTKFYVRKVSKTGKKIGSDQAFPSKDVAIRSADRRAQQEGFV